MTWNLSRQKVDFGGRYTKADKPKYVEELCKSDYEHRAEKPSLLAKNATIPDPENSYMICPRCEAKGPIMEHGDHAECECGLNMETFGNGLTIWLPLRLIDAN